MRIALISSLFEPFGVGGAEQVAADLAENLHKLGHGVDVISTCSPKDLGRSHFRVDIWKGIRVWRIAPWNVYWSYDKHKHKESPGPLARTVWHAIDLWNPTVFGPLNAILDQIKPDVINTHNIDGFSPVVWQIARKHASTIAHTLHDYHLICPRAIMQNREGKSCEKLCKPCSLYSKYFGLFQSCVDVLISPAHAIADLHRASGWLKPKVVVVRNAVDLTDTPKAESPAVGPLQAIFMGRLESEKGCEILLSTMQQFEGRIDIQFHVAGRGTFETRFIAASESMSNCKWHGFVTGPDKNRLLSQGDVFLQLSEWRENAPLALLEAKQNGLYLVGTRIGGIPEIIDSDIAGELIAPGDIASLQRVLQSAVTHRDEIRTSRTRRLSLCGSYTINDLVNQYVAAFS